MNDSAGRLGDFLVIGAPKAGTTAFYRALARHPRIFMTQPKEPMFFSFAGTPPRFAGPGGAAYARGFIHDEREYRRLFTSAAPDAVAGEASTIYLTCERAAETAARYVPQAKLIAILRHPVERAYSQYLHVRHEGNEPCTSFERAWDADDRRHAEGWVPGACYRRMGFYAAGLSRWLRHYPRERLLILFYEEWCARPAQVLDRTWRFLGVEPPLQSIVTRENVSSLAPRWPWLHHRMIEDNPLRTWAQRFLPVVIRDAITTPLRRLNLKPAPQLAPMLRRRLATVYHDDLDHLQALTGRDLSAWRT